MKNLNILAIGGVREIHQRLRERGARLTLLTNVDKIRPDDHKSYDRIIGISASAPREEWLAAAAAFHEIEPFSAIGAYHERTQSQAAFIAQNLKLQFHSEDVIANVSEKCLMRKKLREIGIDLTRGAHVSDSADVESFAALVGYPIIMKPVNGAGSSGVSRIDCFENIESAFAWLKKANDRAQAYVEEFLDGQEYSVEALSENGRHHVFGITQKFKESEHFVEIGHVFPAAVSSSIESDTVALVQQTLDALGIKDGMTHTEVIVTANGPRIVETHTRLGGDHIPLLIKESTGLDLFDLWAKQTMGEPVLPELEEMCIAPIYAAIWFGTPQTEGTVCQVDGEEIASAKEGVRLVEILRKPGMEISKLSCSFSRTACVAAVGASREQALAFAKSACEELKFIVDTQ